MRSATRSHPLDSSGSRPTPTSWCSPRSTTPGRSDRANYESKQASRLAGSRTCSSASRNDTSSPAPATPMGIGAAPWSRSPNTGDTWPKQSLMRPSARCPSSPSSCGRSVTSSTRSRSDPPERDHPNSRKARSSNSNTSLDSVPHSPRPRRSPADPTSPPQAGRRSCSAQRQRREVHARGNCSSSRTCRAVASPCYSIVSRPLVSFNAPPGKHQTGARSRSRSPNADVATSTPASTAPVATSSRFRRRSLPRHDPRRRRCSTDPTAQSAFLLAS